MKRIFINPINPEEEYIKEAADILLDGGLVIFPTETVYGLAVDPACSKAIEKVYIAKGRRDDKPLAHFALNIQKIEEEVVELNRTGKILGQYFWPGALTIVVPSVNLGFRIPDYAIPLKLLEIINKNIAVTSANLSGHPDALTANEAIADLGSYVDLILDGGAVPGGKPSTVVMLDEKNGIKILRHGAISEERIKKVLIDNNVL